MHYLFIDLLFIYLLIDLFIYFFTKNVFIPLLTLSLSDMFWQVIYIMPIISSVFLTQKSRGGRLAIVW